MLLFRPAAEKDLAALASLAAEGGRELPSLPRTLAETRSMLDGSLRALAGDPDANRVVFVVEREGQVAGVSSIARNLGRDRPFYSFKRSRHARRSYAPPLSVSYETLQLTTDFDGYSALSSLYLSPSARGGGAGRLLSLGRLAFVQQHPRLFSHLLMADIRGWLDERGQSPFWQGLAGRFIDLPIKEADRLSFEDGRFISDILPALPILLNLLGEDVAACAGRPHAASVAAMRILEHVGFRKTDLCDVFDGGPAIECAATDTLIATSAQRAQGMSAGGARNALLHFVGEAANFRATIGLGDAAAALADSKAVRRLGADGAQAVWLARIRREARDHEDQGERSLSHA